MAEAFGVVAGALSVAALFNNCVESFGYIQMGRHFGQNYERCQLKLDIAQARLSMWGRAAGITDASRFTELAGDERTEHIRMIFEEIGTLFTSLQQTSKRYELGAEHEKLVPFTDDDMHPLFRRLHDRLSVHHRQKQTSLVKKTTWALYDGKNFDKLVKEITGFIDDLEKLYPVEAARRQLVQLGIEDIDDEPALATVRDVAKDVDNILAEAAAQKSAGFKVRNKTGKVSTQEKARVRIGNEFAGTDFGRAMGFLDETTNMVGDVDAKGEAAIHIGQSYGGRGIFD